MRNVEVPFAFRRDIPWNFELDPNGDLKMKEDIDAVNQSIYTILSSNFRDKNFEELFGSDMESVVFELSYPEVVMAYEIESKIRDSIKIIEPKISILELNIDMTNINNYTIRVFIKYLFDDGLTQGIFDESLSFIDLNR